MSKEEFQSSPMRANYFVARKIEILSLVKKCALILSIPLIFFSAWKAAVLIAYELGCEGKLKEAQACILLSIDIQPMLSIAVWWGMLMWLPALIISIIWAGTALQKFLKNPK